MGSFQVNNQSAILQIRVQPNAQKNQVVGILSDGRIKIKIQAPPLEGKANKALFRYLYQILDVPESQMELVRGDTSRDKIIRIDGISESDAIRIIKSLFAS